MTTVILKEKKLTDGSIVFDIVIKADGGEIMIHTDAVTQARAFTMADGIADAIRNTGETVNIICVLED